MATVVGVDCTDGALLAGDRLVLRGEAVAGRRRHVVDLDDVGAATVDGDPDVFRRRLEADLRAYRTERGEPRLDAVARMADDTAAELDVRALVAARDDAGRARVRSVGDGVLDEQVAALGSGAPVVLGRLESMAEPDLDAAERPVREALEAASARDPGTGGEVDVWRLADGETV